MYTEEAFRDSDPVCGYDHAWTPPHVAFSLNFKTRVKRNIQRNVKRNMDFAQEPTFRILGWILRCVITMGKNDRWDGDKDNVGIPHGKVYVPLHSNYDNQYYLTGKNGSWYHT